MSRPNRERDQALNDLTSEFATIPVRIVIDIFLSYLERTHSVGTAMEYTRGRIADACVAG